MQYDDLVAALRAAGCVFAEEEATLLLADGRDVGDLAARRAAGEPLEVVLGWAAFRGLRLQVAPGAFVPRRRTELLAGEAIRRLHPGDVAVELCCGVAPVAAALLAEVPGADVWAADVDPAALAVARRNVPADRAVEGDLFSALPTWLRGRVQVLAANTPYVPASEIELLPAEARLHEPRHTLDGGPDGLALLRRIAAEAPEWLAPGGHLLIEVSEQQLPTAVDVVSRRGLEPSAARDDDLGAVVAIGRR
jgi:release factor glutamine methyltransferase